MGSCVQMPPSAVAVRVMSFVAGGYRCGTERCRQLQSEAGKAISISRTSRTPVASFHFVVGPITSPNKKFHEHQCRAQQQNRRWYHASTKLLRIGKTSAAGLLQSAQSVVRFSCLAYPVVRTDTPRIDTHSAWLFPLATSFRSRAPLPTRPLERIFEPYLSIVPNRLPTHRTSVTDVM
jgi:hypothetical protein